MFNPNEHMMKLKGKDYLQVMWRLVWFREDHPDWSINPSALEYDADHAIFKAEICDENGVLKCSAHGSESKRDFGDYLEKAETKAVGRALAMLGYGTQFTATELDEGERIVDSPVDREQRGSAEAAQEAGRKKLERLNAEAAKAAEKGAQAAKGAFPCERCGNPIKSIKFGDGNILKVSDIIETSKKDLNGVYCYKCYNALMEAKDGGGN